MTAGWRAGRGWRGDVGARRLPRPPRATSRPGAGGDRRGGAAGRRGGGHQGQQILGRSSGDSRITGSDTASAPSCASRMTVRAARRACPSRCRRWRRAPVPPRRRPDRRAWRARAAADVVGAGKARQQIRELAREQRADPPSGRRRASGRPVAAPQDSGDGGAHQHVRVTRKPQQRIRRGAWRGGQAHPLRFAGSGSPARTGSVDSFMRGPDAPTRQWARPLRFTWYIAWSARLRTFRFPPRGPASGWRSRSRG